MGTNKPKGRKGAVRKRSQRKAAKMAGREIDRLADQAATSEERAKRKRRLIKGPREFRDLRGDLPRTFIGKYRLSTLPLASAETDWANQTMK